MSIRKVMMMFALMTGIIRKVMMMFALMTGIVCAGHAQEVKNDSTATTKAEELKPVKDVYPQTKENGDLYHGLTRKLMFDRMIPPHGETDV